LFLYIYSVCDNLLSNLNEMVIMSPEEWEMFEDTYMSTIGGFGRPELRAFLDAYRNEGNLAKDLYTRFECYTAVMDALLIWENAVKFTKEQSLGREV